MDPAPEGTVPCLDTPKSEQHEMILLSPLILQGGNDLSVLQLGDVKLPNIAD